MNASQHSNPIGLMDVVELQEEVGRIAAAANHAIRRDLLIAVLCATLAGAISFSFLTSNDLQMHLNAISIAVSATACLLGGTLAYLKYRNGTMPLREFAEAQGRLNDMFCSRNSAELEKMLSFALRRHSDATPAGRLVRQKEEQLRGRIEIARQVEKRELERKALDQWRATIRTRFNQLISQAKSEGERLYRGAAIVQAHEKVDRAYGLAISQKSMVKKQWDAQYERMSWWQKLTCEEPDWKEHDARIETLNRAKSRIENSGDLEKTQRYFKASSVRAVTRLKHACGQALDALPKNGGLVFDADKVAKNALILSALSVPVSMWGDIASAGNVYDALRGVNGNFEGMSDFEIWLETAMMPADSLAGLASLTKGAYFEQLVAQDTGGVLFEHFNHPETDIVIDGVEYQIKATESAEYIESVSDGVPIIATTEVAAATGVADIGISNAELEQSVDLALGGSVFDVKDTAVDAILTGAGGLGVIASIRGVLAANRHYKENGDLVEAAGEGVGVAITGTAKAAVDTAELGYKVVTSRPSRFVGRAAWGSAKWVGRRMGL